MGVVARGARGIRIDNVQPMQRKTLVTENAGSLMALVRRERQASVSWLKITGVLLVLVLTAGMAVAAGAHRGTNGPRSARLVLGAEGPQVAVEVGSEAPDFTLPTVDGDSSRLSDLEGDKNVILVFFRGAW